MEGGKTHNSRDATVSAASRVAAKGENTSRGNLCAATAMPCTKREACTGWVSARGQGWGHETAGAAMERRRVAGGGECKRDKRKGEIGVRERGPAGIKRIGDGKR